MQLIPHHMDTHYVCLQLKPNTAFKHRFTILSQDNPKDDLNSQVLGNAAVLYRISQDVLSNKISDDTLVIKLTMYLNM